MLKNYLKIAWRQLKKQKMYAAIKIGGFAGGIAVCLLITLYIRDELSYDRSYPKGDRIYRMIGEFNNKGKTFKGINWPAPFARALKEDYPEIEQVGRLMPYPLFYGAGTNEVMRADQAQNVYEAGFTYADPSMLDILGIPMVYGDAAHALSEPNTMVLSKRKADKYFPNQDPVGKLLVLNNDRGHPYKIGGVMADPPSNSHLQYDFLLTLTGKELWPGEQGAWRNQNYPVYMLLRPGASAVQLETKLKAIVKKYMIPSMGHDASDDVLKTMNSLNFRLQPVADIHLRSYDISDDSDHGDIRLVRLFGVIACLILIIACINFINLSTARSASRAKEVGLRKVIGSRHRDLMRQFLTESMLYSFFSFVLGLLLAWALMPYFNSLTGKGLSMPWGAWWLFPLFVVAVVVIGLVSGAYPAFYLSAFQPMRVLKGQLSRGSRHSGLRGVLVVFQFAASIVLIIATIVVGRQMQFILHAKIGFDKDRVVLIEGTNTLKDEVIPFKEELLKLPEVTRVSISDYLPVSGTKRNTNSFYHEGRQDLEGPVYSQFWNVDEDYIPTMGMRIVVGRNFSRVIASDSDAVVVSQTFARKMQLSDPVGKRVLHYGRLVRIIGLVEDFHFESLRDSIFPLCLALGRSSSIVSVKLNNAELSGSLQSITAVWRKFSPDQPIRFTFMDERFASMYADVQRTGGMFSSFSILAIVLACLGLFALSAFMADQRSKEVGIRKVLGATVVQVTALLSKDFVRLVVVALLIASPVAWWAMNKWLQDFEYRITMSWWIFLAAGFLVAAVALFTISAHAVKAAVANPVKSLRTE